MILTQIFLEIRQSTRDLLDQRTIVPINHLTPFKSILNKQKDIVLSQQDHSFISSIISDSKEISRQMPAAKIAGVSKLSRKYYELTKPEDNKRINSKFFGKEEKAVVKKKYQFKSSISEAIGNKIAIIPDPDATSSNERMFKSIYNQPNKNKQFDNRTPINRNMINRSYKEIDQERLDNQRNLLNNAGENSSQNHKKTQSFGYNSLQAQRPKTAGIHSNLRSNKTAKEAINKVLSELPSTGNKVEIVPYADAPSFEEFEMRMNKIQSLKNAYSVNNTTKSVKQKQRHRLPYRDPPKLARKKHRLNTLECIRPKHAKKIINFANLFKLFSSNKSNSEEKIKLNLQNEFMKHKEAMHLLSMFESKKFTKDLQFYKHFGTLNIREYGTELPEVKKEPDLEIKEIEEENRSGENDNDNNEVDSKLSDDYYSFCQKQIPLNLSKQEYIIYSSIDNLLRHTMKKKNKLVLNHAKIVDMCDDISDSVKLLIDYFLHTPLKQEPTKSQNNLIPFFLGEKIMSLNGGEINCEDNNEEPAVPEFVMPEGNTKGLFISLMLDSLWKVILLKIDDILLHQKEMIKDEVREKSSLLVFDK